MKAYILGINEYIIFNERISVQGIIKSQAYNKLVTEDQDEPTGELS